MHYTARHTSLLSIFVTFDVLFDCCHFHGRETYINQYNVYLFTVILSSLFHSSCWSVVSSLSLCYVLDKGSLSIRLIVFISSLIPSSDSLRRKEYQTLVTNYSREQVTKTSLNTCKREFGNKLHSGDFSPSFVLQKENKCCV